MEVLRRARSSEGDEFALERTELAGELVRGAEELNRKAQEVDDYYSRIVGVAGRGKSVEMLLSPRVVPLLEALLSHPPASGPASAEQPEAAPCEDGACGRSTTREDPGECQQCGRILFASVAVGLDLSGEQERRARVILASGQARLYEAVAAPREDGRTPLADLWLWTKEAESTLLLLVPGRTETYAELMERHNESAARDLARILEPDQQDRLSETGIELFWMHPMTRP
ncbi:MAG: hypothetical protein HY720_31585 [Planctomycetes bacterium]|nr:hypothetical protein [Planctomycetota bacterium]